MPDVHIGGPAIVIKGLAFSKGPKGWLVKCRKGAPKPAPSQVLDAALDEIERLRGEIFKVAAKIRAAGAP